MAGNLAPHGWHQRARTRGAQAGARRSALPRPPGTGPPPFPGEPEAVRRLLPTPLGPALPKGLEPDWLFRSKRDSDSLQQISQNSRLAGPDVYLCATSRRVQVRETRGG